MTGYFKAKTVLEFDKLLDHIADKCVSKTGRAKLLNSVPYDKAELLQNELERLQDMREVYQIEGGAPIWDYCDVRIYLNKCEPAESYLETKDFQKVQNFTELIAELIAFRIKLEEKYPKLRRLLSKLEGHTRLLSQFRYTFEPSGKVFDNASPELKRVRKEISSVNSDIHIRLERIMRKNSEHIQEEYLTLRDGRLVLPVREFSVNKVAGIVHGQSSSGSTYFIEPMPVVELNNQIQKLYAEEKKEVVKILKRLSRIVQEDREIFIANFNVLNELDTLQARARYSNETNAVAPQVNSEFEWKLQGVKHPLLLLMHPQTTEPLDLKIGRDFRQLIITGPNAGGKTVALKTLGINQLLFQCGFHIPAGEGTAMPLCSDVFAVIGDEQSIEHDLSTFSSHVQTLKEILASLKENSLILIDEIGSGTEPSGGAALAIAILEQLNQDGYVTVATTHLNQLKVYAGDAEHVQNGAMQFDREKLTPLFSLETGIPGSSYTLDICRRLGLDELILERAATLSGDDVFKLDILLAEVNEKSRLYQKMKNDLSIKESQLNGLIKLYEEQNAGLKRTKKQAEKEAVKEGQKLLATINKEIESAIREIRESQGEKQVIRKARERIEKQKSVVFANDHSERFDGKLKISDFKIGMKVRSLEFDITGAVSKVFKGKGELEIERNGLKISVPASGVEIIGNQNQGNKTKLSNSDAVHVGGANVANELDLRGLTVDEALGSVASYLDQAICSSWKEVRLIHGKGSGTLRQAVHQCLSARKDVGKYRLGKWGEGDSGVTVVQIK